MRRFFPLLFCLLLLALPARAHPGGTDSKGGHTNHSTGEYHYHHGDPAHQHVNGFCPYATCTPTPRASLFSSSGSSSVCAIRTLAPAATSTPRPTAYSLHTLPPSSYATPAPAKDSGSGDGLAVLAGAGSAAVVFIVHSLIKRIWRS